MGFGAVGEFFQNLEGDGIGLEGVIINESFGEDFVSVANLDWVEVIAVQIIHAILGESLGGGAVQNTDGGVF